MAASVIGGRAYRRIATEEAWISPELLALYQKMLKEGSSNDPGFESLWRHYGLGMSERCIAVRERMLDLGVRRIGDMDTAGIDMQILLLTTPGVQLLDTETAIALAAASNDQAHPGRFAALAAIAPQAPQAAAKELERAVTRLESNGAVINSHTRGEYLDDQKFWPIFEAAEALDVPIYIHPNTPPADMIGPLLARGLDGAIYGFAVECGMHLLTIMARGVFDRFPKLQMVFGYLGEGLLDVPARFHAPGPGLDPALRMSQAAQAENRRLHARECLLHDERHGLGAGHHVYAIGRRRRSRALRHGLSVPICA